MMKRVFIPLVFLLAIQHWPTLAQDTPSLSTLEISLWPEFDRAEVLVIYKGFFAPDTPLPVPVEIRIPARVGQPHAVAYESEGRLLDLEYASRQDGEWQVVAFAAPTHAIYLEYYDEQLSMHPGGSREFTFSYLSDYPVAELSFKVQVPPDAEQFVLEPSSDFVAAGDFGLDYHTAEVGVVDQGQELTWTVSYEKTGSVLTEDILFPDPTPVQPALVAEDHNSTFLIFLVGFLATIGVGAGAFWLGRRTQSLPESPAPRRRKRGGGRRLRPSVGTQVLFSDEAEAVFCFRCGAELRPESDFCHKCGAEARR